MNSTLAPQSAVHHVTTISELLSLIFAFSLPDERRKLKRYPEDWSLDVNSHLQYPSISEKETPLSLAHVSRPWRSVAFATPKLWACLHLHMDRQYDSNVLWTKRRLDALLFWLKQSRSLPLSVRISRSKHFGRRSLPLYGQCSDEESDTIDKDIIHLTKIMDALVEHTWRWENISIDLPETVTSPLNNYTNHEFPYLKTFELKHSIRGYPLQKTDVFHHSALNLESLAISGLLPTELPPNLRRVSYANMTMCVDNHPHGTLIKEMVLSKVKISDKAIIRFAEAFPLLEKLVVSFVTPSTRFGEDAPQEDWGDEEPVHCLLKNLVSLSIRSNGCYFPLNLMSTPLLKELKILCENLYLNNGETDDHGDMIIQFLDRSNPSLQKFSYSTGGNDGTNKDLESILRVMPDLQELSVENPKLCSSDLRMLQDPSVCPRLNVIHSFGEVIHMHYQDEKEEPDHGHVIDLIQARCSMRQGRGLAGIGFDQSYASVGSSRERVWVKRLELPLREETEWMLRGESIFRKADVEFINTHTHTNIAWSARACAGSFVHNMKVHIPDWR